MQSYIITDSHDYAAATTLQAASHWEAVQAFCERNKSTALFECYKATTRKAFEEGDAMFDSPAFRVTLQGDSVLDSLYFTVPVDDSEGYDATLTAEDCAVSREDFNTICERAAKANA